MNIKIHSASQTYPNPITDNNETPLLNNILENANMQNKIYAHDNLQIHFVF